MGTATGTNRYVSSHTRTIAFVVRYRAATNSGQIDVTSWFTVPSVCQCWTETIELRIVAFNEIAKKFLAPGYRYQLIE